MPITAETIINLKWKRGTDLPVGMSLYPRVVTIGISVHIGGGRNPTVLVYNIDSDTISSLPQCDRCYFGMATHDSKLVIVGGLFLSNRKKTNELCVWDDQLNEWIYPYPPMTIPSIKSCVISYKKWIIVTGGAGDNNKYISTVELLDTSLGQWYQAIPLPVPCIDLTSCVVGNVCYLTGGWRSSVFTVNKQVFTLPLDELISNAVLPSSEVANAAKQLQWNTIPDVPQELTTVIALQGSLLAVGGSGSTSSDIYMYRPSSKQWIKAGELPAGRDQCGCTVLPDGELFVAGGWNTRNRVDIATVEINPSQSLLEEL